MRRIKPVEFDGFRKNCKVIEFDKFKMPVTVCNSRRLIQEIFARTICGRNFRPQHEMPDEDCYRIKDQSKLRTKIKYQTEEYVG